MPGIAGRTWDRVHNRPADIYTPPEDLVAPPTEAPLIRSEDGAVLGIDWRRTDHAREGCRVPGRIAAVNVMPGDVVALGIGRAGVDVIRVHVGEHFVYVHTRTQGGAEVVHELAGDEQVEVLA